MTHASFKKGFTLIELLVVIAIITLLSGVVFASVQTSREKARMGAAMQFDSQLRHSTSDNLLGLWTFDNTANPWADYSSNGHNGIGETITPTPTIGYNDQNANLFNGTGYVRVGRGDSYPPFKSFTACAWIKTEGVASGMSQNGIFSYTFSITLGIQSDGRLRAGVDNNGTAAYLNASQNLFDNKFHHVCLSDNGEIMSLYIDGALKNKANAIWPGFSKWPTSPVVIGTNINDPGRYLFNGTIDDVSFYGGVMNEAKIEKLFALGKIKHGIQ